MNTNNPSMAIKDDKAQVSPLASSPKVAPTAGGVTVPGVSHLPWKRHSTLIYFANVAGGFNVRYCPDPENLAAFIVRACNAHDELLALARQYASECAECGGKGLVGISNYDGHGSDADDQPCEECADIRAVIAKVTP